MRPFLQASSPARIPLFLLSPRKAIFMNRSLRWAARTAHALAGHLNRLRDTLDLLSERLRDAIARAVGQHVAGAAQEAVESLLADTLPDSVPLAPSSYARSASHYWQDPGGRATRSWQDEPDDPYRPMSEEDREEDWPEAHRPTSATPGRRWGLALAVGCQTAAWWLRRQTGRFAALAAVGVGLASTVVAFLTGPVLLAGADLAGSALTLAALSDAARFGAAVLFGVARP
jgi:hypothetical protein